VNWMIQIDRHIQMVGVERSHGIGNCNGIFMFDQTIC
jgi:hypothetical protein